MRWDLLLLGACVACAWVGGCSGSRFTAAPNGTGGSSAAGGAAAAGGTAASGGAAASGGSGACSWGHGDCPAGMFCNSCTGGTCIYPLSGPISNTYNPVCGCNGVTYWNLSVAHEHAAGIRHDVRCSLTGTAKACGPTISGTVPCNAGRFCDLVQSSVCAVLPPQTTQPPGTCWVLPASCPDSPAGRDCGATTSCASQCSLIKTQQPWYADPGCT